jgi:hypothetical protein
MQLRTFKFKNNFKKLLVLGTKLTDIYYWWIPSTKFKLNTSQLCVFDQVFVQSERSDDIVISHIWTV